MDRDSEWYLQLRSIALSDILVSADPVDETAASNSTDEPDTSTTTLWDSNGSESVVQPRAGRYPVGRQHNLSPAPPGTLPGTLPEQDLIPRCARPSSLLGTFRELPDLPNPLPNPAYHDLDPVQWMAAASAYTSDPVEKLTLEADLHDAWDYLVEHDTYPTVIKEYSDE
ncbi:MAG: hypothetical protein U1U88_000447 [Lawsonella clevelandensis]